ncbi:hypothetical protein SNE40_010577 [Patella caerulea]|uniref:Endonuclease/exonuclease/phosphatase domain-containing protein n=1 Tax=Patella caerulea TaxID=87958 RepID=A0AAN8K1C6_PATCE
MSNNRSPHELNQTDRSGHPSELHLFVPISPWRTETLHETLYDSCLLPHQCLHFACIEPVYNDPYTAVFYWVSHVKQTSSNLTHRSKSHRLILLLIAGIEPNPGPGTAYPCGQCQKECKTDTHCNACDNCDFWFHRCSLNKSSSTIYLIPPDDTTPTLPDPVGNTSTLSPVRHKPSRTDANHPSTPTTPNTGQAMTSSPAPQGPNRAIQQNRFPPKRALRILNANFQSIRKRGDLLEALIDLTDPDIILGTETWLDGNVASTEFLPDRMGYKVARKDMPTNPHGGVLIAAKNEILMTDIKTYSSEMISATLSLDKGKKVLVAVFYRPPDNADQLYLEGAKKDIADFCCSNIQAPNSWRRF